MTASSTTINGFTLSRGPARDSKRYGRGPWAAHTRKAASAAHRDEMLQLQGRLRHFLAAGWIWRGRVYRRRLFRAANFGTRQASNCVGKTSALIGPAAHGVTNPRIRPSSSDTSPSSPPTHHFCRIQTSNAWPAAPASASASGRQWHHGSGDLFLAFSTAASDWRRRERPCALYPTRTIDLLCFEGVVQAHRGGHSSTRDLPIETIDRPRRANHRPPCACDVLAENGVGSRDHGFPGRP